jgi:hypothetical protein
MIEFEYFTYTGQQWDRIKVAVRDALDLDDDQIERHTTLSPGGISRRLRDGMQTAATRYLFQSATKRQSLRRDELVALRKSAEGWRASIIDAIAIPLGHHGELLLPGVDVDMPDDTSNYFSKLSRNLERMIEQAGQRGDNARKTARDHYWSELLAIWRELGGKQRGVAAAEFLWVATHPVMPGAVPAHKSVVRWLERHRATR